MRDERIVRTRLCNHEALPQLLRDRGLLRFRVISDPKTLTDPHDDGHERILPSPPGDHGIAAAMSDPTVEELLEELQDLLAGIPAEARPVVIKLAMQHVLHRHEQLMPLAPTGVEKEQIEMASWDLRAQLAAFKRESAEEPPE
jgi:hypothetical protein